MEFVCETLLTKPVVKGVKCCLVHTAYFSKAGRGEDKDLGMDKDFLGIIMTLSIILLLTSRF